MSQPQTDENAAAEDFPSEIGKEDPEKLTTDDIYHLLQNERRRSVLRYLNDVDGPVRMRDLAEQVAAWEYDTTVEELTSQKRRRVHIALYQAHLPKLDDAGVIDYDQSRGIVERKSRIERLERYLVDEDVGSTVEESAGAGTQPSSDTGPGEEASSQFPADSPEERGTYYVGTAAAASGLVVGITLGALAAGALASIAVGMMLGLAFSILIDKSRTDTSHE